MPPAGSLASVGTCEMVLLLVRLKGALKVTPRSEERAKKISKFPGERSCQAIITCLSSARIVASLDASGLLEIFFAGVKLAASSDEAAVKISKRLSPSANATVMAT